jgi:hypothetical protein
VTVHYGPTGSNSYLDYWVVNLDGSGVIKWQKSVGGFYNDRSWNMLATIDGGLVMAGASSSNEVDVSGHYASEGSPTPDFWIVKLNALTASNSITTTVPSTYLCPGQTLSISYVAAGTFNTGNIFTAQLSDAAGGFTSPVNVGSVSSVNSGSINCTIPALIPSGSGYRIRVTSSNPAIIGSDNGSDIMITCPVPTGLIVSNITGTSAKLSWMPSSCSQGYQIRYRKSGTTSWTTVNVASNSKIITGLSPSTTYQWSVKNKCAGDPIVTSSFAPNQSFTTLPLRTDEEEMNSSIKAFPNPFHQATILNLSELQSNEEALQILITDLSGKILFAKTFSNDEKIEIGNELLQGFYLVEVKKSYFRQLIPVVKE